jgi:hypothetical protein
MKEKYGGRSSCSSGKKQTKLEEQAGCRGQDRLENQVKVNLVQAVLRGSFGVGRSLVKIGQASGTKMRLEGSAVDFWIGPLTRRPATKTAVQQVSQCAV